MKDLQDKFSEIERRVKALVTENADLRRRVAGLEQELSAVRRDAKDIEDLRGRKTEIREKIERVLRSLEDAGEKT